MTRDGGFDPRRLPDPEVQDPDVSRDVDLGTATRSDFTAPDTAPVADAAVGELLDMLDADERATRRRAILALAERDAGDEVRPALHRIARSDPDAEARQFAVEALAHLTADVETIRVGLEDPDPWVRAETVVSLKKGHADAAVEDFEAALEDAHPAVRRNGLISLYVVREAGATDELLAALDDESERVREWAVRLLATLEHPDLADRLAAHLEDEESDVVRQAAARALDGDVDVDPGPGDAGTDGSIRRAGDHVLNTPPGG